MTKIPEHRLKMIETWKAMHERLQAERPPPDRATSGAFVDYAWNEFDLGEVLNILFSEKTSYYAHKDILYEGLCAWVCGVGDQTLIRQGITTRTAFWLDLAETAARDMFGGHNQLGDIYARVGLIGQDFLEDVYYPIGGVATIFKSISRSSYRRKLFSHSEGLNHTARIL